MSELGYGVSGAAVRDVPDDAEVVLWCDMGQESFHPDMGEFWLPEHIRLSGDWNDVELLKSLSGWLDNHYLKVARRISELKGAEDEIYVVPA